MKYAVIRTDTADAGIRKIILYIALFILSIYVENKDRLLTQRFFANFLIRHGYDRIYLLSMADIGGITDGN